jgi:hypothetical protein
VDATFKIIRDPSGFWYWQIVDAVGAPIVMSTEPAATWADLFTGMRQIYSALASVEGVVVAG